MANGRYEVGATVKVYFDADEKIPNIGAKRYDGTLVVSVDDATAVTRVLVEDSNFNGSLYYADRPKGKWLLSDLQSQVDNDNGNYAYVCTNCNHTDIHAKTQKVPYCWWCGARMKGADDERHDI